MIRSSQRPLPDKTQHSQQTNIHATVGIRTHNLSRRAAADLRLRPRGHWDRLTWMYGGEIQVSSMNWTVRAIGRQKLRRNRKVQLKDEEGIFKSLFRRIRSMFMCDKNGIWLELGQIHVAVPWNFPGWNTSVNTLESRKAVVSCHWIDLGEMCYQNIICRYGIPAVFRLYITGESQIHNIYVFCMSHLHVLATSI